VRPRGARAQYGYAAAQISRLTASLQAETQFINTTLRFQLRVLRARARQARQNNPFARRFVQMVVDNVCGPAPFRLEGKVRLISSGQPNKKANDRIEECWESWGRPGNCELTGKWSWNTVQRLLAGNLATDGELLLRKLKGPQYGKHGYRIQVIDVDRLWEYKNEALPNGGAIHASIEVDADAKPVAYWILRRKPSQWQFSGYTLEMDRVPAEEIIHVFVPEFAEQVRGVPWMYAALLNLVNMGAFEEAAVIAARVGAAAMGFIESPDGMQTLASQAAPGPKGDGTEDWGGEKGDPSFAAEPGMMIGLPPGYKFNAGWNPKYPDAAVEPFIKAMLRGVSAGLGVAYHNLANDLEGVNYSSARIGELDERDMWMGLQTFFCEHLHGPLYCDWMPQQVLMGQLNFPAERLDQYQSVYFQGRRWAWVDPLKEVGASIEAINAKIKSRTRIAAENGEDLEDVLQEIKDENTLAAGMGITFETIAPKTTGAIDPNQADGTAAAGGGEDGKNAKVQRIPRWRDPRYADDSK
jgi:lambda family phage portal protein